MRSRGLLLLLTLVGFALRVHEIGALPLRWDEGWSIALAVLPVRESLRLTALDVHPPLYYLLLAPWLWLARAPELWVRLPSAMAGTAAVPLASAAAAYWWRRDAGPDHRVGLAAAATTALAPAFIYYAGVTRMYASTTPWLLLCVLGLARCARRRRGVGIAAIGAAGALHTFYYTGFALAGLFVAAFLAWPRAWRRISAAAAMAALAYGPWLAVAAREMSRRVAARTDAAHALAPRALAALLDDGLYAAWFAYDAGWWAVAAFCVVLAAGVCFARPRQARRLAMVLLPPALVVVGAAVGSQAHMFAARYLIGATPFLALGLGWAIARVRQRSTAAGRLAALCALAAAVPSLAGYSYAREAEVSGDYDPSEVAAALADHGRSTDLVAFNVLSLAGAYELYRSPGSPAWTYAQVWDPVREPDDVAVARVEAATRGRSRLWLALYRGTASEGSAALKAWADRSLYPAAGWWTPDLLMQSYVNIPSGPMRRVGARFSNGTELEATSIGRGRPDTSVIGVRLVWKVPGDAAGGGRVFVHAYGAGGDLVAQHDAFPVADSRPASTWLPGETLEDRHGLTLPEGTHGRIDLYAGLYDPDTGQRWPLVDGSDRVLLGALELEPASSPP